MNRNYFVISDSHFSHSHIIDLCNRPFHDAEMMNDYMVMKWNQAVKHEDVVYHLGDLFWNEKAALKYLPLLNGEIHLILCNHDKNWKKARKKLERSPFNPDSNLIVEENSIVIIREPISAVLCHYPLMSWDGAAHGVWHFCGHTHNNIEGISAGKRINVCVENIDYTPINLNMFKDVKSVEETCLYNKNTNGGE